MKRHEKRQQRMRDLLDCLKAIKAGRTPVRIRPSGVGKKVTRASGKSAACDRETVRRLRLSSQPARHGSEIPSVIVERMDNHLRPLSPSFSTTAAPIPDNDDDDHKPARWRDVTDRLRFLYWVRAIASQPCQHFTMRLGLDLIQKADTSPHGFANYLQKLIARTLKRKLGRPVDFCFAVEMLNTAGDIRPHLHGVLAVTEAEAGKARRALKRASGDHALWFRNRYAVVVGLMFDPIGWASYCAEGLWNLKTYIQARGISATQAIKEPARQLYEADLMAWKKIAA